MITANKKDGLCEKSEGSYMHVIGNGKQPATVKHRHASRISTVGNRYGHILGRQPESTALKVLKTDNRCLNNKGTD